MVEKPPTKISDIMRVEDEDAAGELGYVGSKGNGSSTNSGSSGARPNPLKSMNVVQMLITVLAALIISLLIILQMTPTKGSVSGLDERLLAVEPVVTSVGANTEAINALSISLGNYAPKGEFDALSSKVNGMKTDLDAVPMSYAKTSDLSAYAKVTDLPDISVFQSQYESIVSQLNNKVDTAVASISDVHSLEYSLAGSGTDYKLKVLSDTAGSYVARITLVYDDPLVLFGADISTAMQDFYVTYLDDPNRDYMCNLIYEAAAWKATEVYFITSAFTVEAGVEKSFDLRILGLQGLFDDYEKAYVEILPGHISGTGVDTPSI